MHSGAMTMQSVDVTRVVDADNHLGETPTWSVGNQSLWWVNCDAPPELHRWSPATGRRDVWPMPSRIGGVVLRADGTPVVVLADGVYRFTPETGDLQLLARSPLPAQVSLHECATDRQGRLWVGSFDHRYATDRSAAGGSFFRLEGETLVPVITGIAAANGLAISPDGTTLYAADSAQRVVLAYDLDPVTGDLGAGRTFVHLDPAEGFVDGAAVDAEGGYWLAVVAAAQLRRYLPDGTLHRTVALPCSNPTKPVFGGTDLGTLYVTSTQLSIRPGTPGAEANGGIFALRPGWVGLPETPFRDEL